MVKDLLQIIKDLLYAIETIEFTEDERNYIISVIKKIIDVLISELD